MKEEQQEHFDAFVDMVREQDAESERLKVRAPPASSFVTTALHPASPSLSHATSLVPLSGLSLEPGTPFFLIRQTWAEMRHESTLFCSLAPPLPVLSYSRTARNTSSTTTNQTQINEKEKNFSSFL